MKKTIKNLERQLELLRELMNKNTKDSEVLHIGSVVGSTWKPTMMLRWREDDWNATLADFDKTLEQKWISDTGEQKWEEVPLA